MTPNDIIPADPMPNAQPVASRSSVSTDAVGVSPTLIDRLRLAASHGIGGRDNRQHLFNEAANALAALRSATPQQEAGLVVKEITWTDCKSLTGRKLMGSAPDGVELYRIDYDANDERSVAGLAARKATSQADFERRVLACIHPSPATADETLRAEVERLRARVTELTALLDQHLGTPCDQIRAAQEVERLHADREAVWYWIRRPDWAEEFSQRDLLKWLEQRPSHLTAPLRPETPEREKAARAALSERRR